MSICKSKNRNEKIENELLKQIEKDFNNLLILSEHKIEIENEINFLSEYHLKKSNETIDNYEKSLDSMVLQQGLIPQTYIEYKNEKALSLMPDDISITGSSNSYFFKYFRKKRKFFCEVS